MKNTQAMQMRLMSEEELAFHQALCKALDEALMEINDPATRFLSEEEFFAEDGAA